MLQKGNPDGSNTCLKPVYSDKTSATRSRTAAAVNCTSSRGGSLAIRTPGNRFSARHNVVLPEREVEKIKTAVVIYFHEFPSSSAPKSGREPATMGSAILKGSPITGSTPAKPLPARCR